MCSMVLNIKLKPQLVKTLEMRAKSVWRITIRRFTPIILPPEFWRPYTGVSYDNFILSFTNYLQYLVANLKYKC